ncbi:MAG: hypothetical protein A2Z25_10545 [Planctomycetes bacterium RBG_16_55_9]|nr:MAG: hypothetical protein A2Z25_10545 [Planctomycetes bacterium RBG_16_55_9]
MGIPIPIDVHRDGTAHAVQFDNGASPLWRDMGNKPALSLSNGLPILLLGLLIVLVYCGEAVPSTSLRAGPALRPDGVARASRPRYFEEQGQDALATKSEGNPDGHRDSPRPESRIETTPFLLPAITSHDKPALSAVEGSVALITVGAEEQWRLAVAAPIAARIRRHDKIPILLATAPEGRGVQTVLIKQLAPALNSCIVMAQGSDGLLGQVQGRCAIHVLPAASECGQAGLLAARSFWQSTNLVVVGAVADSEAVILGSTLACHLGVPFIPISGRENPRMLSDGLEALEVKRVLFATSGGDVNGSLVAFSNWNTEVLDTEAIQKRLIGAIGGEKIRNVILFRVPDQDADREAVAWLTPYLSLMRNAAVVPCLSSDPIAAEEKVGRLIDAYSLRPRTVTILAGYDSIEMITTTYGEEPNEYEVLVEPCSRPVQGRAADVGVGRIPCRDVWAASALIARGIAGDYVLNRTAPKVLMIANPSEEYGALPLCETVSRATAGEFKNFDIHTDEFYGVPCHDQAVRTAARGSQLIIYEGHITEFSLFENPAVYPDEDNYYSEQWESGRSGDFAETASDVPDPSSAGGPTDDNSAYASFSGPGAEDAREEVQFPEDQNNPDWKTREIHDQEVFNRLFPPMDPCHLDGAPLVILQSCHSLDDSASRILAAGAIGILGSATNIHSSSGSALVKAFCDGLLYRGQTAGEALREARNYLLCVSVLKAARGHKEQAKVLRVAYGFHLWGDPESGLFGGWSRTPKLKPVSAGFAGPDKIRIAVPKRRSTTWRTSKYFLRMFPGSEVAGIVKRLKDKDIRRITPIYFFRMPMPADAAPLQYAGIRQLNDTSVRAVFLADSFKRFLYVLYFPETEEAGQHFTLQFVK